MTPVKSILLSTALLTGAAFAANAQAQYPAYPYTQPPAAPPLSWYYNPYTSGLGPCPQRFPGDLPCRDTIDPSYGQPSYWGRTR
jgi:hypothetical protein